MDVSIIIVHYGDPKMTKKCLRSIYKSDFQGLQSETLVIDNTPNSDNRRCFSLFSKLKYIKSKKNNYAHALNLAIKKSKAPYVVVLNPDTTLHKNWLPELISPLKKNPKLAGVSSKILFKKSKKINSLGIEAIDDYYYRDLGMDEDDDENLRMRTIKYASGCSVAYRKKALEDIGYFDEDFIMYVEDVDMGIKLRKKGWKLAVNPKSIVYHDFHGTAQGVDLPWYFCNRNRFLIIAKHYPQDFAKQIKKSHTYINKQFDYLYDFIKAGVLKLITHQKENVIKKVLPEVLEEMVKIYPLDRVQNLLNEIELYLGMRKPKVCLYDHALHFIGGGQKYGCAIAEALQKDYDTTLICNKDVKIADLEKWYNLNLKKCSLKKIKLEINKKDKLINPSKAETSKKNPFAPVEDEVLKYDVFLNVNMVPHVNALALKSIFICHFPDGHKRNFFYPQNYEKLIANSNYTNEWVGKKWKLKADEIIYPPIEMKNGKNVKKENLIISVSRFEETGSKKQLEMAKIFSNLCKKNPQISKNWKLVLAGGSFKNSSYLKKVNQYVKYQSAPIKVLTNLSNKELKDLYSSAKIFWHACGLKQDVKKNPNLIEHFGMTTVEAMQNGCAPIVINGGGQKEIIEHGKDGFRFDSESQLKRLTLKLIKNEKLLKSIQSNAKVKSKKYDKKIFQKKFTKLIGELIKDITKTKNFTPEIHHVYKQLKEESISF